MKEKELKKKFEDAKEKIRKELEKDNKCILFASNNRLIAVGGNCDLLTLLSKIVENLNSSIDKDIIMNAVELGLAEDKEKFMKDSIIGFMQDVIDKMKEE